MPITDDMRHHVTTYTPRTANGRFELVCTCGHREEFTRADVEASGVTSGELLVDRKRAHLGTITGPR